MEQILLKILCIKLWENYMQKWAHVVNKFGAQVSSELISLDFSMIFLRWTGPLCSKPQKWRPKIILLSIFSWSIGPFFDIFKSAKMKFWNCIRLITIWTNWIFDQRRPTGQVANFTFFTENCRFDLKWDERFSYPFSVNSICIRCHF